MTTRTEAMTAVELAREAIDRTERLYEATRPAKLVVAMIDADVLNRRSEPYVWGGLSIHAALSNVGQAVEAVSWPWPDRPLSQRPPFDWHGWLLP